MHKRKSYCTTIFFFFSIILITNLVISTVAFAANLYRSVGTTATNLNTGSRTVRIVGTTATFSGSMPNNIGVGDALVYGSTNIAFIAARTSNTVYTVQSATGGTPAAASAETTVGVYRCFNSLYNWESNNVANVNANIDGAVDDDVVIASADLATPGDILNVACYADGDDTTAVTIDGWSTDATHYIKIYTPVTEAEVGISQRHTGKAGTGYVLKPNDSTPVTGSNSSVLYCLESIVIDGIDIDGTDNTAKQTALGLEIGDATSAVETATITNCLIHDITAEENDSGQAGMAFGCAVNQTGPFTFVNNVVYNITNSCTNNSSYTNGVRFSNVFDAPDNVAYLYNNTVYNIQLTGTSTGSAYGFTMGSSATADVYAKNNYIGNVNSAGGPEGAFDGDYAVGSTNNASSDATGDDGNLANGSTGLTSYSDYFVNVTAGSEDLHLSAVSAALRDTGAILSSDSYYAFSTDIDGDTRSGAWDIGADEYVVRTLYRSVGATATNLNTDSRTVEISGTTATFSGSMPNKIGVGDALVYGSTYIAFVTGRTSDTVYTVQSATGGTPTAVGAGTAVSVYRCFTSLSGWEGNTTANTNIAAAVRSSVLLTSTNLVNKGYILNVACYADGAETTRVSIEGWTTGENNYIKIYTPVSSSEVGTSQRHNGVWDTSKYYLETQRTVIYNYESYVRFDGLQIHAVRAGSDYADGISNHSVTGPGDIRISNCIFYGSGADNGDELLGAELWECDATVVMKVWNSIFYGFTGSNGLALWGDTGSIYLYNNTIVNSRYGIYMDAGITSCIAKNNLIYGCTTAASGTFAAGTDYNATNNASMGYTVTGSGNSHDRTGKTITFANSSASDYHLGATDVGGRGYGTDLSSDSTIPFNNDIDDDERSGTWDIGADQQVTQSLYRSVGTTATDLNTDSRTVEISGTTATFSGSMPDTVGVGDALVYGSTSIAFISGRMSSTVFAVQSPIGREPVAASAGTTVGVYRCFNSLYNWESNNVANVNANIDDAVDDYVVLATTNLSTSGYIMNVPCYADSPDTTAVTIDGWTANGTQYIKIYTPVNANEVGTSQRHTGKAGTGYVLKPNDGTTATTTWSVVLDCKTAVIIDGIEIDGSDYTNKQLIVGLDIGDATPAVAISTVTNCIIHDITAAENDSGEIASVAACAFDAAGTCTFVNNILYNIADNGTFGSSFANGIRSSSAFDVPCVGYVYNNTIYHIRQAAGGSVSAVGFYKNTDGSGAVYMKNNYIGDIDASGGNEFAFYGTYGSGSTNNASSDNTADDGNLANGTTGLTDYANYFISITTGAEDLHLNKAAAALRNAGADLSADAYYAFTTDIDGESRTGIWDIGADSPGDYNSWWNTNWTKRRQLFFDNSGQSESLTNFPVLVVLNSLRIDYNDFETNGEDLRFIDTDTGTELSYEIETWNSSGTSYVWVNVPKINGGSTADSIFMYYGNMGASDDQNPSGTWNSDYVFVQHFNETSGIHYDSTANNNDSNAVSVTQQGALIGKIGGADEFVATSNDYITIAEQGSTFDFGTGDFALEAWVKTTQDFTGNIVFTGIYDSPATQIALWIGGGDGTNAGAFEARDSDSVLSYADGGPKTINDDAWHYIVGVKSGNNIYLYADGNLDSSDSDVFSGNFTASADWEIGRFNSSYYFDGILDNVCVSNVARSADWIAAQYKSMNDDNFILWDNSNTESDEWWDTDWKSRRRLQFNNLTRSENLTNFPVLVVLNPGRIDYGKTKAGGADIRFVDADNMTELSYEIEQWVNGGTSYVWVNVPQIDGSSNSDYIYLYYNNSTATDGQDAAGTWPDFVGVWHLNETVTDESVTADAHLDSTKDHYDGDQHNNSSAPGKISGAQYFDGSGDYIDVGDQTLLDLTTTFTIETWVKTDASGYLITRTDSGHTVRQYALGNAPEYSAMRFYYTPGTGTYVEWASGLITDASKWVYVALTVNNTTAELFEDSVSKGTRTLSAAITSQVADTWFGARQDGSGGSTYALTGSLDEMRVTQAVRSAEWINAQCQSMNDADFIMWGDSSDEGSSAWWDTSWTKRQKLYFDNLSRSETLTNFPVLVVLNPSRIDYGSTQNNGEDIRFIDSDNATELSYEIENWSESGNSYIWVKVPQIVGSSNMDCMYIYYGNTSATDNQNASDVWTGNNYVGVWHLKEDASGTGTADLYKDSTSNADDGNDYVSATGREGEIYKGKAFDGSNDYIQVPDPGAASVLDFDTGDSITLEGWAQRATATAGFYALIAKGSGGTNSTNRNYYLEFTDDFLSAIGPNTTANRIAFTFCDDTNYNTYETDSTYTDLGWYYCASTHTFGTPADTAIYVNGEAVAGGWRFGDGTEAPSVTNGDVSIGNISDDGYHDPFYGNLDEVRISNTIRTADWMSAQYQSMLDANFIIWDSAVQEEAPAAAAPIEDLIWDSGGADDTASNANNWYPNQDLTPTMNATINMTNDAITWDVNTVHSLTVSGSFDGTITQTTDLTVSDTLDLEVGAWDMAGYNLSVQNLIVASGVTFDISTGDLTIGQSLDLGDTAIFSKNGANTTYFSAIDADNTVSGGSIVDDVIFTTTGSATWTLEGNLTVDGNLTIASGCTVDLASYNLSVSGALVVRGTLDASSAGEVWVGCTLDTIGGTYTTGTETLFLYQASDADIICDDELYAVTLQKTADPDDWWDRDWLYRKELVFQNAAQSSDLTNFPVLVVLNSSRIDYTKVQNSGEDIRFLDADGTTELPYEIEEWNESGSSYVWVKVPQINGGSNTDHVFMYYGNSGASDDQSVSGVWTGNNYVGVWHLNETPADAAAGGHADSTENGLDGTPQNFGDGGGGTTNATGKIAGADTFAGDDDYVEIPDPGADSVVDFTSGDEITVEGWAKRSTFPGDNTIVAKQGETTLTHRNYYLQFGSGGGGEVVNSLTLGYRGTDTNWQARATTDAYGNTDWHYYVGVYTFASPGTCLVYADGAPANMDGWVRGTGDVAPYVENGSVLIGAADLSYHDWFAGTIDEVRISNTTRTPDWIAAQYASMNDTFISYGSETDGWRIGNGTITLEQPLTVQTGFLLQAGTCYVGAYDLTVAGNMTVNSDATLNGSDVNADIFIAGNFNVSGGTVQEEDGTLWFYGAADSTVTLNGEELNAVYVNKTALSDNVTVSDLLSMSGDLRVLGGTFFTNSELTLNGNLTVSSGAAFTSLGAGETLFFNDDNNRGYFIDSGAAVTWRGSSGNELYLRSNLTGSDWVFDCEGTKDINYVNVQDSDASMSSAVINPSNSTDNGNNTNWFPAVNTVYYSVGIDTSDFKTTSGTLTLTISGSIATFGEAQADNIGVGDLITYGDSLTASISARTSSTEYTVTTMTGGAVENVTDATVHSIKRAFNSLDAAVDATNAGADEANYLGTSDLVSNNYQLNIVCYADGVDTTPAQIQGWTTGPDNYIKVYTPYLTSEVGTSQRHTGKWTTSGYILEVANDSAINVKAEHVRIDGLQIHITATNADGQIGIRLWDADAYSNIDHRISNNIIRGTTNSANDDHNGISIVDSGAGVLRIWNNIIYDFKTSATYALGIDLNDDQFDFYAYNNTVYNCTQGIGNYYFDTMYISNNIADSNDDNWGDFFAGAIGHNNLSSTNDAPLSDPINNADPSYVDENGDDFHLSAADTSAIDAGYDLSSDPGLSFSTDIDGGTRPVNNKWDIGADEYGADNVTRIYRSVGTLSTALTSGGTLSISGVIATFGGAVPNNVGVGDCIQYDVDNNSTIDASDAVCFISSRISSTQFYVQAADGGVPAQPAATGTTWSVFRAYTSLYNAERGVENSTINGALVDFDTWSGSRDLVTNNEQWNIACYADGIDSTVCTIGGWKTNADHYLKVYTPVSSNEVGVSQRHNGTWTSSGYQRTKTISITCTTAYIRLEGLQIRRIINGAAWSGNIDLDTAIYEGDIVIKDNILAANISGEGSQAQGVNMPWDVTGSTTIVLINNIVYGFQNGATDSLVGISDGGGVRDVYMYNNTVANCYVGIYSNWNYPVLINNLVQNCTDGYFLYGGAGGSSDYNISDLAGDAPNDTFSDGEATAVFVDEAGYDFHLVSYSPGVDQGEDLSSDTVLAFYDDIDGQTRPVGSAWDIGADEASAQIFYSVGTNAGDLKTGSPTIGIADGVAAFTVAQADNVGVGDLITFGDNSLTASIVARTDSTHYTIRSLTGSGFSDDAGPLTVHSIKRAFNALNDAVNTVDGGVCASDADHLNTTDLVSGGYQLNIACYADGDDTDPVSIEGWTTGRNNYLRIFTPVSSAEVGISQRHTGRWTTAGYILRCPISDGGGEAFNITDAHVRVEGLQIKVTPVSGATGLSAFEDHPMEDDSDIEISHCIVDAVDGACNGIAFNDITGSLKIWDNICYGNDESFGMWLGGSDDKLYVYNNTIYNFDVGISSNNANLLLKNNVVLSCPSNDYDFGTSAASGSTNNGSSDTTANNGGLANGITGLTSYSDYFINANPGYEDLHLKLGSSNSLIDAGANLTTDNNLVISDDIDDAPRPAGIDGLWDIGADEAATRIFYSVGTNTANLMTGTPTLDVVGTTATFSSAQSDTIGVGDLITLDNSLTYAITARASSTEYTVSSLTGSGSVWQQSGATVASVKRVFNSLSAAVSGASGASYLNTSDLVTSNYQLNFPCYADGVDSTSCTIDGWTTGPGNYIDIYTPTATTEVGVSQRHDGIWGNGYRLTGSIQLWDNDVRFDGIALFHNSTSRAIYLQYITNGEIQFSNCYFRKGTNGGSYDFGYSWSVTDTIVKVWNCIGITEGTGSVFNFANASSGGTLEVYYYNCTAIATGSGSGFSTGNSLSFVKNCLAYSVSGTAFSGSFQSGSEYNSSDDGTAPGTNSRTGQTFSFYDEANKDYHLKWIDTGAVEHGEDLSSDVTIGFSTDIDGNTRPTGTNWDIGADEASIQIYYSVGTSTADLKNAATLTISGGIATFSASQPDNIGVGDLITYGASLTASIVGRTNASKYTVRTVKGAVPADAGTGTTVHSIKRAFNSLEDAHDNSGDASYLATENLVTGNYQLNWPCYADGEDSAGINLNTWTTGPRNYIRIYTPVASSEVGVSQRHSGKWGDGYRRTNYLQTDQGYVRIEGISARTDNRVFFATPKDAGSTVIISHCYGESTATNRHVYEVYSTPVVTVYFYDCIAVSAAPAANSAFNVNDSDATAYLYNCTGINNSTGYAFNVANGKSVTVKNCLGESASGSSFVGTMSQSYNASDDGTAAGTGSQTGQTFTFMDAANHDYHLALTDTGARDLGANLSTDGNLVITDDIDGDTRPSSGAWDIGADETATQIFYSVGTNTGNLMAGTPTLTISGNSATFSETQPANVGVGDLITYTGGSCAISARINASKYTVQSLTGSGVAAVAEGTSVTSITRMFNSLSDAQSGASGAGYLNTSDLVSSNYQLNFACYADGVDSTAVTINGWTTGSGNYIKVYTPTAATEVGVSQRHNGTWGSGYRRTERLTFGGGYARFDGLSMKYSGNAGNVMFLQMIGVGDVEVSNCYGHLARKTNYDVFYVQNTLGAGDGPYVVKFWNCIAIHEGTAPTSTPFVLIADNTTGYFYNCTGIAYGDGQAFTRSRGTGILKNCLGQTAGGEAFDNDWSVMENCASDDPTAGSSNGCRSNQTFSFYDESSHDYHLKWIDTGAVEHGEDLSSDVTIAFSTDIDGNTRPTGTKWDIGADEAAIQVYYSVGTNAADLKTTADTLTMDINNGVATFDEAQADTIGVGDLVTFGDNSLTASIVARTDSQNYTIRSLTGSGFSDDAGLTVHSIKRAFNSLESALDTNEGGACASDADHLNTVDLKTDNYQLNIPCYADGAETTTVSVEGWTTGVTNYIRIYTPTETTEVGVTQRHSGKWDSNGYRMIVDNSSGLYIITPHVRVDGLQIYVRTVDDYKQSAIRVRHFIDTYDARFYFSHNILRGQGSHASDFHAGIYVNNTGNGKLYCSNNIIYDFLGDGNQAGGILVDNENFDCYVYNNTAYNNTEGFYINTLTTNEIVASNNIADSNTDNYDFVNGSVSGYNNLSSGTDAPGTDPVNNADPSYVDENNDDFHLDVYDTAARDAGENLSLDNNLVITDDIDGNTRPSSGAWDIGADEAATQIFYSVGTDTSALYNDTGSATNGTLTLASAAADNIGVGDEIREGSNRYYIYQRNSSTVFLIQNSSANSGTPGNTAITFSSTPITIYRAFNSLVASITTNNGADSSSHLHTSDLKTNNYQLNIACYGDGEDTAGIGNGVMTFTTGHNNYLKIYTPYATSEVGVSQRHNGKWDTNAYRMNTTDETGIFINQIEDIRIEGLQIYMSSTSALQYAIRKRYEHQYDYEIYISDCILRGSTTSGYNNYGFTAGYCDAGRIYVWNNIIYDFRGDGGAAIELADSDIDAWIYNNTVYNNTTGMHFSSADEIYVSNNIADSNGTNYSGSGYTTGSGYSNLSSGTDAPFANPVNSASPAYVNEAHDDFHLSVDDTVAKDAGKNLSTDGNLAITTDIDGVPRPGISGQYDIGADEAGIQLYRSVGTNAADLNTDSRQVEISGSTATFAGVMPNNVGVGDVVQYVSGGAYQVAFIHARQSAQVYTVKDWEGNAPLAATLTDCNVYRVFPTLSFWEGNSASSVNANIDASVDDYCVMPSTNLTTDNTIAMVPCYAGVTADSSATTIDGWATGIGNYIDIYTPTASTEVGTSQRHSGVWGNGYRRTGGLGIQDEYVRVGGLAITAGTASAFNVQDITGAGEIQLSDCYGQYTGTGVTPAFNFTGGGKEVMKVWNCIGITDSTNPGSSAFYLNSSDATAYLYNCTGIASDAGYGFRQVSGSGLVKNCLGYSNSGISFSGTWALEEYCASDDGTAAGTGSRTGQAFTFVDATNNNYLLADADKGAKDHGEDLSTDLTISFTTDILGTTRPTGDAWDIGANETPAWWDTDWTRRQKLVFDNLSRSENLTSFPVLVVLNSSRIDYSETQSGGHDLRFLDSNGTTKLNFEIEDWNESGTSYVWVRVPQVDGSSQSDFMWMYYGNASASDDQSVSGTWDDNFVLVQHLQEGTTGATDFLDSTKNDNDSIAVTIDGAGSNPDATGIADGAVQFDGSNDTIRIANSNSLKPTAEITVELFLKRNGAQVQWAKPLHFGDNSTAPYGPYGYEFNDNADDQISFFTSVGGTKRILISDVGDVADATWYYMSGTFDGINHLFYIDGIPKDSGSYAGSIDDYDATNGLGIGDKYQTGQPFKGTIDEVRISNTARTEGWTNAQSQSMFDQNFIMWDTLSGGEEKGGSGGEELSMFLLFD